MASSWCVPQLWGNASRLDQRKTQRSAFWSSNDLTRTQQPCNWLLFLHGKHNGCCEEKLTRLHIRTFPQLFGLFRTLKKFLFQFSKACLQWTIKTLDTIQASKTILTVNCLKSVHNRRTVLQTLNLSPRPQASSPGWNEWFSPGFISFKESSRAFGIKIARQKSCWSLC